MRAECSIGQACCLGAGSRRRINGIFKRFRYISSISSRFSPILEISMSIATLPAAKLAAAARGSGKLFRLVLFVLGGILAALALNISAGVDESRTLIIPPNDGYGFEECLKAGSQCGLVVADAWCKAHGFAGSNGFGPADETAATMDEASRSSMEPGSFHVTCGDRVN
jgi:hypothetical protein